MGTRQLGERNTAVTGEGGPGWSPRQSHPGVPGPPSPGLCDGHRVCVLSAWGITGPIPHIPQAVLERPVPEVATLPVRELRLPLLAPNELATLESHNQRDLLIPVSCRLPFGVAQLSFRAEGCCRAGFGGRPHYGHADAPSIPVTVPIGGEHRGSLAGPRAEEGQRGALPPLPAPAWHAAP